MHATLAQLEKLGRIQAQQREAIATKANDFDTQERHEALVAEMKEGAKSLHDRAEQLGTSINAVEEQLAQLSNLTQHKAEAHEVDEVLRQNDAVQGQVSALKGELEGKSKVEGAELVGKALGKACLEKGVKTIVFDRNGFIYHGRVKALADAAREAGLEF